MTKLEFEKRPYYSGKRRYITVAKLQGETIADGETQNEAQRNAMDSLFESWKYSQRQCEVRTLADGTVVVFRQTGEKTMEYQFFRNDRGEGSCMGQMTRDGKLLSLREFADYTKSLLEL